MDHSDILLKKKKEKESKNIFFSVQTLHKRFTVWATS